MNTSSRSGRVAQRLAAIASGLALALVALPLSSASLAVAQEPAPGPIHGPYVSDPQTPNQPVQPRGKLICEKTIFDTGFRDWDIHRSDLDLSGCGERWSSVILTLHGSVKGVQYDRLGFIRLDGTTILLLSTPEPSADGLSWTEQKDITRYSDLLRQAKQAEMFVGNTVNSTYTGVFDITVTLSFYAGPVGAETPDRVLPLTETGRTGGSVTGTITAPRNMTRVLAEVYAVGWGGGCEEFWDISVLPEEAGSGCAGLPHREVEVRVDGHLAGVAQPYLPVYTGGWSNPYLWQPSPSPHAFDVPSLTYDLTPFAGLLNDGRPHEVSFTIDPMTDGGNWYLNANLQAFTDQSRSVITGGFLGATDSGTRLTHDLSGNAASGGTMDLQASRTLTTRGWLDLPGGRVTTTVTRTLAQNWASTWTVDYNRQDLTSSYDDLETVLTDHQRGPDTQAYRRVQWQKNGYMDYRQHTDSPQLDITTDLFITHTVSTGQQRLNPHGKPTRQTSRVEVVGFDGRATWQAGIPRAQRHPVSEQRTWSTVTQNGRTVWNRELIARNGVYTNL